MSEQILKPEFSEDELRLIERLKESPNDPETKQMLLDWTTRQEAEANRLNTSRANIEADIKRAKLHKAAGFEEEAWEVLEGIRRQAMQEGEDDLYQVVMRIMDEIDSD